MRIVVGHRMLAIAVAAGVLVAALLLPCATADGGDVKLRETASRGTCGPCLHGDGLLWTVRDMRSGTAEIRIGASPAGKTARLRAAGVGSVWHGDSDGSTVVWQDSSSGDADVVVYNPRSGAKTIIDGPAGDCQPAVWGNRVVFERRSAFRSRIMVYEIDSESLYSIDERGAWDTDPDIYEDTVVFVRNGDIDAFDLASGEHRTVVARAGPQDTPSIWRNRVAYADWADGLADLRLCDLATQADVPLVSGPGVQFAPSIWGDTLAFEQYSGVKGIAHSEVAVVPLSGRKAKRSVHGVELTVHSVPSQAAVASADPQSRVHGAATAGRTVSAAALPSVAVAPAESPAPSVAPLAKPTAASTARRFPTGGWSATTGSHRFTLLVLCALMAGTLSGCAAIDDQSPYPERLEAVDEATATPVGEPTSSVGAPTGAPRRTDAGDDPVSPQN